MRGEVIDVPRYLQQTYWWAYVHPRAVSLFERQWLVNAILWGNFGRLRDAALDALGAKLPGRTLQIACVYGDLTDKLRRRLTPGGSLDVVDVLPVQLDNLARKLPGDPRVGLMRGDSSALDIESGSYDRALLFFLLHEQPEDVRRKTLAEALRIVTALAHPVLRHRILRNFHAESEKISGDDLVDRLLGAVQAPSSGM